MSASVKSRCFSWWMALVILFSAITAYPAIAESATVEAGIRQALQNQGSYAFMISDDYVFVSTAVGCTLNKFNDETYTTNQSEDWARNSLINSSTGYVVRIDRGVISMGDSTSYGCEMHALSGDQGVSIRIYSINDSHVSASISGAIRGNKLNAYQEYTDAYYFSTTNSSTGNYFAGSYEVSVVPVQAQDVAPQPVNLACSLNRGARSITLNWTDPTPSGSAAYYEIYRALDVSSEYDLAATVSNCSSWTDASSAVQNDWRDMVTYYIVSYSANGVASKSSNYVVVSVFFWN